MAVSEDPEVKQENAYIKEIEECIFDQDITISYKKLSKSLNIHINRAKRLLHLFVEQYRRGKRALSIYYLVSGEEISDTSSKSWRVCVVPEIKLEATLKLFRPESVSTHIYSVHQGSDVLNTEALAEANKCSDYSSGKSAIENKNAVPYDNGQMEQMVQKVQPTTSLQVPLGFANKKPTTVPQQPAKSADKEVETKKTEDKETKDDSTVKTAAKGTINSMFAAQSTNKPATTKPATNSATNKKGGKMGSANIASFFQRQKEAPPMPKKTENIEKCTTLKEEADVTIISDEAKQSSSKQIDKSQASASVINGKTKTAGSSKVASKRPVTKSKKKDDGETTVKRKRIIAVSDSESSDDEEAKDEEAMQIDSPPPPICTSFDDDADDKQKEKEPKPQQPCEGIIKEKRLVDKVYQDEKGFIVTKKEWVVEARKVEDLDQEVKLVEPVVQEKPVPAKRKQQSDIMSFFNRK